MASPIDLQRLEKLLLVMLSTDQGGEAVAASASIVKLLKKGGKDIHWLAGQLSGRGEPQPLSSPQPPVWTPTWESDWLENLSLCVQRLYSLRPREVEFVNSVVQQQHERGARWAPSVRQREWLEDIAQRLKDHNAS